MNIHKNMVRASKFAHHTFPDLDERASGKVINFNIRIKDNAGMSIWDSIGRWKVIIKRLRVQIYSICLLSDENASIVDGGR
jgi:hypothetical protein